MSLGEDLLVILSSYSGGYRLMRARMHGYTGPALPGKFKTAPAESIRVTLSRLKKRGFVENKSRGVWALTQKGIAHLAEKFRKKEERIKLKNKPKNMIIAFDIPERFKRKRNWLRQELTQTGFTMLQKSLWLGPAPVSEQFIHAMKDMELLGYIKFLKVGESDIV